jgi:hypothetical protein
MPALERPRQKDFKFESSLGYIHSETLSQKTKTIKQTNK